MIMIPVGRAQDRGALQATAGKGRRAKRVTLLPQDLEPVAPERVGSMLERDPPPFGRR